METIAESDAAGRDSIDVGEQAAAGGVELSGSQLSASVALRLGVVALTAAVAATVPNLGLVISLLGSLSAPVLLYIVPAVAANIVLGPASCGPNRRRLHWAIAAAGLVGIVVGTGCTLSEILAGAVDVKGV